MREQVAHCLRSGLEKGAKRGKEEGRGAVADIQPEDRGCEGIRGGQREVYGDTEGSEVVIRCVHGICKGQSARLTMDVNVAGIEETSSEQAIEVRDEMSKLDAAPECESCGRLDCHEVGWSGFGLKGRA